VHRLATNFPSSLDNFTNPVSGNTLDSPSHSLQHSDANDAIEAIEAKLGVGASPAGSATAGQVLTISAAGTSAWTTPVVDNTAWTSYTPTWTNLTVGNGTSSFKYKQIGKNVFVIGRFQFGTTSSMGSDPQMSLPITSISYHSTIPLGVGTLQDSGTNTFGGYVRPNNTTSVIFTYLSVSGSLISASSTPTSTLPFTWTTNDALTVNIVYEAA